MTSPAASNDRTPSISVAPIGTEGEVLVTIDDLAPDVAALRAAAAEATFASAGEHYPGIRAPLPESYLSAVMPTLLDGAARAFGPVRRLEVVDASFSIVTAAPETLSVIQRVPHCDAFTRERIAMIHYLAPDPIAAAAGGTAFYRHRATGFERVDEARRARFFATLRQEVSRATPEGYIAGDTPLFEQIASAPARCNRAYLYRSWQLHSGAIPAGAPLSPDPAAGRLTITAFFVAG